MKRRTVIVPATAYRPADISRASAGLARERREAVRRELVARGLLPPRDDDEPEGRR